MEACYAEGSKNGCHAIPPIPLRELAHQNGNPRDSIVASTSDDSGQSFGIALATCAEQCWAQNKAITGTSASLLSQNRHKDTAPKFWSLCDATNWFGSH